MLIAGGRPFGVRAAAWGVAGTVSVAAGPAAGQIAYLSQSRVVWAGSDVHAASGFEPFYQGASAYLASGYCAAHLPHSASAGQSSTLNTGSIAFDPRATCRGISAASELEVVFQVEPGAFFRLAGTRRYSVFGPTTCNEQVIVTLTGPGIDYSAPANLCPNGVEVAFANSGLLAGGQYTLRVTPRADFWFCFGGGPTSETRQATGSLTITPASCAADSDFDHAVTPADVAYFVQTWLFNLEYGIPGGDFDGNGLVQPADLALFVQVWLAAASGTVPPC